MYRCSKSPHVPDDYTTNHEVHRDFLITLYICVCVCIYIHTHSHTYTHTQTHTHTLSSYREVITLQHFSLNNKTVSFIVSKDVESANQLHESEEQDIFDWLAVVA